jgi:hypothetical protein
MRISKLTWTGIACLVLAITAFGGWGLWLVTRTNRPVYLPVSLTPGGVHIPEFRVNLSGPYEIRIEAKKQIPFDTLNCMLGMAMASDKCDVPPVVEASWAVTSKGVVIAKGVSDAEKGGAWANDTIERQIGSFQGERNQRYALDVDFTADGSALAPTDPHLVVEITSDFYEGSMWISSYLLLICSGVAIGGVVVLAASAARVIYRRKRGQQPIAP